MTHYNPPKRAHFTHVAQTTAVLIFAAACTVAKPTQQSDGGVSCDQGCTAPTGLCNRDTQLCVQCTSENSAACTGDTAVCDTSVGQCVECTAADRSACTGAKTACDTSVGKCVQCSATDPGSCTGDTPICGSDNTCHACTMHSECSSKACMPDGTCLDTEKIAYVEPAGSGTACTRAMPCASLQAALNLKRPFVKVTGTVKENVNFDNQTSMVTTILGDPGSKLTSDVAGENLLTVVGTSHLSIVGLEISAAKATANGIQGTKGGIGIYIPGSGSVALERVVLSDNDIAGIQASGGKLDISNSQIMRSPVGVQVTSGTISLVDSTITENRNDNVNVFSGTVQIKKTILSKSTQGTGVRGLDSTVTIEQSTISENGGYGILVSNGALTLLKSNVTRNRGAGVVENGSMISHITNNFIVENGADGPLGSAYGGAYLISRETNTFDFNTVVNNKVGSGGNAGGVQCDHNAYFSKNNLIGNNTFRDFAGCTYDVISTPHLDPSVFLMAGDYHLSGNAPASIRDGVECFNVAGITVDKDIDDENRPANGKCDLGADEYSPK